MRGELPAPGGTGPSARLALKARLSDEHRIALRSLPSHASRLASVATMPCSREGSLASPLFRGDRARGAGNGEVPRSKGLPARGQGVTGRGASAIGGRQSPRLGSAPPRDALGAEPLGKCPVPNRFIQRISGTGR